MCTVNLSSPIDTRCLVCNRNILQLYVFSYGVNYVQNVLPGRKDLMIFGLNIIWEYKVVMGTICGMC